MPRWIRMTDAPKRLAIQVQYDWDQLGERRRSGSRQAHPFRIAGSPLASPLTTLNTRMVLSEEQVARRLP